MAGTSGEPDLWGGIDWDCLVESGSEASHLQPFVPNGPVLGKVVALEGPEGLALGRYMSGVEEAQQYSTTLEPYTVQVCIDCLGFKCCVLGCLHTTSDVHHPEHL